MQLSGEKDILRVLTGCSSRRLRARIYRLLHSMKGHGRNLRVRHIDTFYYKQKTEELELLEQRLEDSIHKTLAYKRQLEKTYREVFKNWKRDVKLVPVRPEIPSIPSEILDEKLQNVAEGEAAKTSAYPASVRADPEAAA